MTTTDQMPPVMLYDGACGLCARSVQLLLRHDRRGLLKFAPLEGRYAAEVRGRHPELIGVDSVVWVEPDVGRGERVFVRCDAVLRAARYLGGIWVLAGLAYVLPRAVRDAVYASVASHRHNLGLTDSCVVRSATDAGRFLD